MSKNIHKLCTVVFVLISVFSSCTSPVKSDITLPPSPDYPNSEQAFTLDAIATDENESDSPINRIKALDAEFETNTPVPNGSTASMMAYAEAYLELWQGEVNALLTAEPSLAQSFATFELELKKELDALTAEYQAEDGALYGSAVTYELTWHRASSLRDWLIDYYS